MVTGFADDDNEATFYKNLLELFRLYIRRAEKLESPRVLATLTRLRDLTQTALDEVEIAKYRSPCVGGHS